MKPKFAVNMNPSTAINRNWQKVTVLTQLGTSLKTIIQKIHDISILLSNSQGEQALDLTTQQSPVR